MTPIQEELVLTAAVAVRRAIWASGIKVSPSCGAIDAGEGVCAAPSDVRVGGVLKVKMGATADALQ